MDAAMVPTSINGIEFDAHIEDSRTYEADVPSYPVEGGYSVTDSIILKPMPLNMTLIVSSTPVTWRARHGYNPSRVQDVIRQLEGLYFQKEPVTVITPDRVYQNMAITSIEIKKSLEDGNSRVIPISFQEIQITESATTTIPDSYGRSGATGTNAGTASTTSSSASSSGGGGSIAYNYLGAEKGGSLAGAIAGAVGWLG